MKTNIDLYKKVLTLVRKNGVGTLSPAEYLSWVSMAQQAVVMAKLPLIDTNVRIKADLLPLYKLSTIVLTPSGAGAYVGDLPQDYLRLSGLTMMLVKDAVTVYNTRMLVMNDKEKNEVLGSVYARPSIRKCYYNLINDGKNRIMLYVPDTFTPTLKMTYYCTPIPITNDGVINASAAQQLVWDDSMVDEIAQRCASMYIECIEGQRYQSLNAEQSKNNNNQ